MQDSNAKVQFIDDDTFVRFDEMEYILDDDQQIICLKVGYFGSY